MASSLRKRKHSLENVVRSQSIAHIPELYIQAYEADVERGSFAQAAAQSLEASGSQAATSSALVNLAGNHAPPCNDCDESSTHQNLNQNQACWVDRYDARLLLDDLDIKCYGPPSPASDGWSDLSSDTGDTFLLSVEELEHYQREKRRKLINDAREERLKALMEKDEEEETKEDVWGGSDEEAEESIKELMRRTATHLLLSPNPAQLEMRILANHGGDQRFAFLRGRWSRHWKIVKYKQKLELDAKAVIALEKKEKAGVGLGLLDSYGNSDDDDADADSEPSAAPVDAEQSVKEVTVARGTTQADDAAQQARRVRAREWAEKRRALKSQGQ